MLMLFAGRPLRRAWRCTRFFLGVLVLIPALLADISTDLLTAHMDAAARLDFPIRISTMVAWTVLWLMCVLTLLDHLATFGEMAPAGVRDEKVLMSTILDLISSANGTIDKEAILADIRQQKSYTPSASVVVNATIVVDGSIVSAFFGLARSIIVASTCIAVIASRCVAILLCFPTCCAIFTMSILLINFLI